MALDPNLQYRPLTAKFREASTGSYIVDHLVANCEVSATCVSAVCVSAISATVSGLVLKELYTHEGKKIDFDAIDSCSININALDIDGGTDIGAALVDADLLIVDDGAGGTNRKSALSRMKTYVLAGSGLLPTSKLAPSGNVPLAKLDMTGSGNVPISKLDLATSGKVPLSKLDMTGSGLIPTSKLAPSGLLPHTKVTGGLASQTVTIYDADGFTTHSLVFTNGILTSYSS